MVDFIFEIIKAIVYVVLSLWCAWTGEIVLFIITFGRHKPQWDLYTKKPTGRFVIFSESVLWIGIAFWIAVIAIFYKLFN